MALGDSYFHSFFMDMFFSESFVIIYTQTQHPMVITQGSLFSQLRITLVMRSGLE